MLYPAGTSKVTNRNNLFQRLEVVFRNREKRTRYGEFLVEGFRSLERAVQFGWKIRAWVFSSERGLSVYAKQLIAKAPQASLLDLSQQLLAELSSKEDTSELLAMIETPEDDLSRIKTSTNPLQVVFDRPQSPGNLGTNLRSCDAFGVDGVYIVGHSVDLYDPETVRASVGSIFAVPVIRRESWAAVESSGFKIIGTSSLEGTPISEANLTGPIMLLIGNERLGLSKALKEACHEMVTIPQTGSASSLNVSCATAVLLYERCRQMGLSSTTRGAIRKI